MLYTRIHPPSSLTPYIEFFWSLDLDSSPEPSLDYVLPDGRPEIIFHYGTPLELQKNDGTFLRQSAGLFAGQLEAAAVLRSKNAAGMLAIRFRPAGAFRFFPIPQSELVGCVTDISDVLGRVGKDLTEKVCAAKNNNERLDAVIHFLEGRLAERPADMGIGLLAARMEEHGGNERITELASSIGLSCRQLERRFKREIGLSPKTFTKVLRFQRFVAGLKTPGISLLDTALRCGYYDQSHLIREFKAFTGASPLAHLERPMKISDTTKISTDVVFVQSAASAVP